MQKTYPIYRGVYGQEPERGDFYMVTVEVIAKYPPIVIVEMEATVHFPLSDNVGNFIYDIEQEYGDGAIVGMRMTRMGS